MSDLPSILASDLRVVFCGTAVGERSASQGHYYSGRGNAFWDLLHQAGFTPLRLAPEQDQVLLSYGIGLTDLAPGVTQSHDRGLRAQYDVPGLVSLLEQFSPRFIAFTSLEAARAVSRDLAQPAASLGLQEWSVGPSGAFALPSPSGANRRGEYQGRPSRLSWWRELAGLSLVPSERPSAPLSGDGNHHGI